MTDLPDKRYTVGVLYPNLARQIDVLREDIDDSSGGSINDELLDDPVVLANQWLPSSVGLTFYTTAGRGLRCRLLGAAYERVPHVDRRWIRLPLSGPEDREVRTVAWPTAAGRLESMHVLGGRATLEVNIRELGPGRLVTVSLVNALTHTDSQAPKPEDCLYQVAIECSVLDGNIEEYPRLEYLTADPEEEELFVLYRRERSFALGHGCATGWSTEGAPRGSATSVRTEFVPRLEVPGIVARASGQSRFMALAALADESIPADDLAAGLVSQVDEYAAWIKALPSENSDIPTDLFAARDRLLSRLSEAEAAIRRGVALLASDPIVLRAFRLANLAMLMQMHHSKHGADLSPTDDIDYLALQDYAWFPFQIAFFLVVLPSLADPAAADRDIVDLIWFPTGGGKTEAYLLISAFEIVIRRLRRGERGAGTAVFTRYTLRLLTTQQFQRAAALACALEVLRRARLSELGSRPIRIGLWVGIAASPNTFQEALEWHGRLTSGGDEEQLPLERCPWCATRLIPADRDSDDWVSRVGIEATNSSFKVFCPSLICRFHHGLPISIVDQDIYETPPSILIGTVDKFARLAWVEGAGLIFGGAETDPPSLIIQDELHLIAGPLGTTVGLYEAAIEGLLEIHGARPKVIASTATIRRSSDQTLGIFGRDVRLFPPSGLDASDSFFAHLDSSAPGRMYLGVMSQSHTSSTTLIRVAAYLAQAPVELSLSGPELDAFFTQVIYHNSLRELGKSVTFARDDIPAWIELVGANEARRRRLPDDEVVELTSNVPSRSIPEILSRLNTSPGEAGAISLLLATNMIQVGIDVPRLGLMLMNGQPKTTSEFIQATSRIGRGAPGLVVTMYSSTKARDRSHYESFGSYHRALYRHVEPASVTPFSLPSRERALHAALIILVRHGAGLSGNADAGRFDPALPPVARAIDVLLRWAGRVDPLEASATADHLARIVQSWHDLAASLSALRVPLHYYVSGQQHHRLIKNYGEVGGGTTTLQSMRSVDLQAPVDVLGSWVGG